MKLRAVLITLAALCAALPVRGQQLRVTGVVRDTGGSPVSGVVVATTNVVPSQVVFTKADGRFALEGVLPDTAILELVHLGYYAEPVGLWRVPKAPQDSTLALTIVVRPLPIDMTPASPSTPLNVVTPGLRDAELEVITRSAGLRQLRAAPKSMDDREIRVYVHGINAAVSLRRRNGHVFGQVWLWWLIGPDAGSDLEGAGGARGTAKAFGCGDIPWRWATVPDQTGPTWRAVLVCRPAFWATPDWPGLWRRLDSLGVWRLKENAPPRRGWRPGVTRGAVVSVELFDGRTYRLVRSEEPDSSAMPEPRRATAIGNALNEAFWALRYNPTVFDGRPYAVRIKGTVRDTEGAPVPGALVTAPVVPTSARTGVDGRFEMPHRVPWGESRLVVEKAGFQPASYPIENLPGWRWDSGGYQTEIVVLRVGQDQTNGPCAGPDEFSREMAGYYAKLASSNDPSHIRNREALGIPEVAPSFVVLVTDPRLCARAGVAYARAERDSILTGGRVPQPSDSTLGRVVYLFRVGHRYVILDKSNMAGEWVIGWVFDSTLTIPVRRNGR